MSSQSDPIIGIDLGTTNSCIGVWKNGQVEIINNSLGQRTTPSWIAFKAEQRIIGQPARRQAATNPKTTIFDVKRLIGRRFNEIEPDLDNYAYDIEPDQHGYPLIKVEQKHYKPEELSAMILDYLKKCAEQYLNQKVKKVVITVPAYFNDSQRQATKNAVAIAGMECLRIINEPTAACLCYGLDQKSEDLNVLVFDLGGGTFDVSILNLDAGVFQVLATAGDTQLGGEDLDWLLTDKIISLSSQPEFDLANHPKRLKRLHLAAEQAKRELSVATSTEIMLEAFFPDGSDLEVSLTRNQFELLIKDFLERCFVPVEQVLKDADLTREQINEIVLVGGSTRIPIIREQLSRFFNNKALNYSVNPDEAVAYGATVQAAILSDQTESSKVKDLVLLDVTPLSLGIETSGGIMAKIVERNTNIPCQQSKMFSTAEDNQESVLIHVFEGERKFTSDNAALGTFELGPIPSAPRGVPKIKVTFKIDSNGILEVSAIDQNTGLETQAQLTPESGRLTTQQIQEMIRSADQYKVKDEIKQALSEAITQFEKYLYNVQQAVNDATLNDSLSPDEISFVNQYLINSFQWINDNRNDSDRETVLQAQSTVEYTIKPIIQKLYSY